jgi:hypothetical protein
MFCCRINRPVGFLRVVISNELANCARAGHDAQGKELEEMFEHTRRPLRLPEAAPITRDLPVVWCYRPPGSRPCHNDAPLALPPQTAREKTVKRILSTSAPLTWSDKTQTCPARLNSKRLGVWKDRRC